MRIANRFLPLAVLSFVAAALPAAAQTTQPEKPVMVEDIFKNVQVMKAIPVGEFMDTMGCVYLRKKMTDSAGFKSAAPLRFDVQRDSTRSSHRSTGGNAA